MLYQSSYCNAYLCGQLDDGRAWVLMCGSHQRNYPYFDPRSEFSDLLMVVGDESFSIHRPVLPNLRMSLGPNEQATIGFHGDMENAVGEAVNVDLELNLFASRQRARQQGIGVAGLAIGLSWEPALLVGTGSLTVRNRRWRMVRGVGEMEKGKLNNLRGQRFEFGYEYSAAARCDGAPAAHVRFETYPLHTDARGDLLRTLLRMRPAAESVTLEGHEALEGDVHQLQPVSSAAVVIGHDIDLGPAIITRELVHWNKTHPRYAFRERIEPKAARSMSR